MDVVYLQDFPEYIPVVAGWIYQEFAHEFKGQSLKGWTEQLQLGQTQGITTILILENDQILGTATLDSEDLPLRPDLSPWLASVYVPPEHRSRGIASQLIRQIEQEARKQGFPRLYLHTSDQEAFYSRRGWQALERLRYWEKDLVVMFKDL